MTRKQPLLKKKMPKVLTSFRINQRSLEKFKVYADKKGIPYTSLMAQIIEGQCQI